MIAQDQKFQRASNQLDLIEDKIGKLRVRSERADRGQAMAFLYTYRLELSALEEIRDRFQEYVTSQHHLLGDLEDKLANLYGIDADYISQMFG